MATTRATFDELGDPPGFYGGIPFLLCVDRPVRNKQRRSRGRWAKTPAIVLLLGRSRGGPPFYRILRLFTRGAPLLLGRDTGIFLE